MRGGCPVRRAWDDGRIGPREALESLNRTEQLRQRFAEKYPPPHVPLALVSVIFPTGHDLFVLDGSLIWPWEGPCAAAPPQAASAKPMSTAKGIL
jgi:hypothetical protein